MVPVPAGWFLMGSKTGQDNERPVHRVWVDSFQLGACQVTNREYDLFLQETGTAPPPCWNDANLNKPQQPVVSVSWFEAVKYCEWLSSRWRQPCRLPTEAEWERAARGGVDGQLYPWGDPPPQSRPDYQLRWKVGTEPVATQSPNEYGLFDIGENVHEWCSDWFQADYYLNSPERNPIGPESGERKASRGGSWRHQVKISRSAARASIPPAFQYADYGFRVAIGLQE